ncbi:uncharacterized protein LOC110898115 isoform X1 [Helianthus annuus]|nr:uncharacterized protein LOC110898115 isoform X1 [Helianthus annuus]
MSNTTRRAINFQDLISFYDKREEEIKRMLRERNLPTYDLTADDEGSREHYFNICVPLYEASIRCDWKALNAIFQKHPSMGLERCSITENGETALHVAASVKRSSKQEEKFVKNLVVKMRGEDLILDNKDFNTALYLAAAAGNIEIVRIIVEKNKRSRTIPGSTAQLMPLYVAALFGNYQVVKYLYDGSKGLQHEYWNDENKGSLLEKCVEADMFDIALDMVERDPSLGSGGVLENLARKPDAFADTKSNVIKRYFNSVVGAYENESEALQLLKRIWKHII